MTSKKSLWVNRVENQKRRIVVWIISILGNMAVYPVALLMYYTRIRERYARGDYGTVEYFRQQMKQATCDALCFEERNVWLAGALAVMIVVHGFSYLYSRRKQDLYLSVPVSMKDRFKIIYTNGIVMYLVTSAFSVLIALGAAVFEGAIDGNLFGRVCLSYLYLFLFFMCIYNLALLALMMTGNVIVTGAGFVVLLLYGSVVVTVIRDYAVRFFDRVASCFRNRSLSLFLPDLYTGGADKIAYIKAPGKIFTVLLPYMGGMLLFTAVTFVMSYWLYKRRPAEAAGESIAFVVLKPILKFLLIVPGALLAGMLVYDMTEQNVPSLMLAIVAGGVLIGMAVEVIFEKDIRAALQHMVLTVVGTCVAFAVFGVIKLDLIGYDAYVPKPEDIESFAIYDGDSHQGRSDHWCYMPAEYADEMEERWEPEDSGYFSRYIDQREYIREHMFLTDAEAICSLANKTIGANDEDLAEKQEVTVLYRLKNGREVARNVWFDFGDDLSAPFLNRIYGAPEYVEGIYQAAHMDEIEKDNVQLISYSNGVRTAQLGAGDEEAITRAWVNDMKKANFTYFRSHLPIGRIEVRYQSYRGFTLLVYEDFTETIDYLKQRGKFIPQKLTPDEVDSVTVRYYGNSKWDEAIDEWGSASPAAAERMEGIEPFIDRSYEDKQQIAEILEAAYSGNLYTPFSTIGLLQTNLMIEVILSDSDELSLGEKWSTSAGFLFFAGKVPEFVIQDFLGQ